MVATTTVQARVDEKTKKQAKAILSSLHITLSEAVSMYLKQIIFHRGIPFELKIPNDVTEKTLKKIEAGEDLHEASSADELFRELGK
jgi:DNA-damage-inducible protein J